MEIPQKYTLKAFKPSSSQLKPQQSPSKFIDNLNAPNNLCSPLSWLAELSFSCKLRTLNSGWHDGSPDSQYPWLVSFPSVVLVLLNYNWQTQEQQDRAEVGVCCAHSYIDIEIYVSIERMRVVKQLGKLQLLVSMSAAGGATCFVTLCIWKFNSKTWVIQQWTTAMLAGTC